MSGAKRQDEVEMMHVVCLHQSASNFISKVDKSSVSRSFMMEPTKKKDLNSGHSFLIVSPEAHDVVM